MPNSFYKILLNPSAHHLSLPPDYLNMQLKKKISKSPIIRSANGGYSWRLKIKKIGDSYCFTNGWNNVVTDIQLGFADFLFFQLVDHSTFKMSVYSPNGCEKILPPKIDEDYKNDDEVNVDGENPFFTIIINHTHKKLLRFPTGFAELVGIDGEGTMVLKNLDGKEWVVGLRLDKSYRSSTRYYLSSKWRVFRRQNRLFEGDKYVFKFIRSEGKLLVAKVPKKKQPSHPKEIEHDNGGPVDEDYKTDDNDRDDEVNVDDENPSFTMIINKTHKYMLRFPAGFAELAGIDAEGTMVLKNRDGKEWVLGLKLDRSYASIRYYLSSKWTAFRRENRLSEGDECVFKFIRSEAKLLLAKVIKKKRSPRPVDRVRVVKRASGDGGP
ncbi:hypothetical protein SSX86_027609 [Deinandra increscens subsp. villosa]|uniref:TF-B3 domain-containing protein n=1 Tax=Deinandra increscens subsp. villosa TaxID=3103831 RepID=A0AAP0GK08_9ASTR